MPLWLEQFVNEHPWVFWTPLVLCVLGAAGLWAWQSRRTKARAVGGQVTVNDGAEDGRLDLTSAQAAARQEA